MRCLQNSKSTFNRRKHLEVVPYMGLCAACPEILALNGPALMRMCRECASERVYQLHSLFLNLTMECAFLHNMSIKNAPVMWVFSHTICLQNSPMDFVQHVGLENPSVCFIQCV